VLNLAICLESLERERERERERLKEQNSEWVRERPCLSYVEKGYDRRDVAIVVARPGEGRQKNWRDTLDVSSFYFT